MKQNVNHPPLRFWWLWILLAMLLFALARPGFHLLKSWRSGTFVRRAEAALARGDLEAAQEQSLLALQLRPSRLEALRVLAHVADQKHDPNGPKLWRHIVQQNGAIDQDRTSLGEAALRENAPDVVAEQLAVLLGRPSPTRETYLLAGLLAVRQHQAALARGWFQKALELDPAYANASINLGRVELRMGRDRAEQEQGLSRLQQLGMRPDDIGLDSLRSIVQWGVEYPAQLPYDEKWADRLRKHPRAGIQDRCLAADWEIKKDPRREKDLVSTVTAAAAHAPPEERREAGVWLNHHGLYEKTLSVFPPDPKSPDTMALVQLDALAALGRWNQIRDFLKQGALKDQPVLRTLFSARVAREQGDRQLFELGWRQALREAGGKPGTLDYLIMYAERLGEWSLCADACEALSQQPEFQSAALLKLVPLYERLGETRKLFQTMKRLLVLRPDDTAVLNDTAYLGLLLGDSTAKASERAQAVYFSNPQLPAFAVTYALSRLKEGRPAEAVKVLEAIPRAQLTAPGWQAVHAASLAAMGRRKEAASVAAAIPRARLKFEEKKLLSDSGLIVK